MIAAAAVRAPGGLVRHLQRTDTNEQVIERADLSVGCAIETEEAIADFAAIGAAQHVEKSLLHIAISPALPLTLSQERRMIALVREVYGIPAAHPSHVVQHIKPGPTVRPSHYHLVFPRYDSDRGKLISSSFTHIKNERASLQLELEFGHPLVPGPHLDTVRDTLAKERPDLAARLDGLSPPTRKNDALKVGDIAKANDHDLDLTDFQVRILAAWTADRLTPTSLSRARARLAHGTKALMVVDLDTGSSHSLVRLLNSASKAAGQPLRLKQADVAAIRAIVPTTDDLPRVSRLVIAKAVETSAADLSAACTEAVREAEAAFDIHLQRKLKREAEQAEAARRVELVKRTIKGQVAAIRSARQEARRVRRHTLSRARRTLDFWRTPGLARGVGLAAGLMTGSFSVGLTLMAATATVAFVTRWLARRDIKASRGDRGIPVREEVRRYYDQVTEARRLDPGTIPKRLRVVAGALYRAVEDSAEPDPAWVNALNAVEPGLADRVAAFAQYNVRPSLRARMLDMYDPPRDAGALAEALAPAGSEWAATQADAMPAVEERLAPSTDLRHKDMAGSVPAAATAQSVQQRAVAAGARVQPPARGVAPEAPAVVQPPIVRPQDPPAEPQSAADVPASYAPMPPSNAEEGATPTEAVWSAATIPEDLRPLAGFYAHLLLAGPRTTLKALGPALERTLGSHSQSLKQRVRVIQTAVAEATRMPLDERARREKAARVSERETLLRMANPLRVDPSRHTAPFRVSKLKIELQKHEIDTKGMMNNASISRAHRGSGSPGRN